MNSNTPPGKTWWRLSRSPIACHAALTRGMSTTFMNHGVITMPSQCSRHGRKPTASTASVRVEHRHAVHPLASNGFERALERRGRRRPFDGRAGISHRAPGTSASRTRSSGTSSARAARRTACRAGSARPDRLRPGRTRSSRCRIRAASSARCVFCRSGAVSLAMAVTPRRPTRSSSRRARRAGRASRRGLRAPRRPLPAWA